MIVTAPVMSHTRSRYTGEPSVRAISELTMKMPGPIIDPITIIVESRSPSSRLNCGVPSVIAISPCQPFTRRHRRVSLAFGKECRHDAMLLSVHEVNDQPDDQPDDEAGPILPFQCQHHPEIENASQGCTE